VWIEQSQGLVLVCLSVHICRYPVIDMSDAQARQRILNKELCQRKRLEDDVYSTFCECLCAHKGLFCVATQAKVKYFDSYMHVFSASAFSTAHVYFTLCFTGCCKRDEICDTYMSMSHIYPPSCIQGAWVEASTRVEDGGDKRGGGVS